MTYSEILQSGILKSYCYFVCVLFYKGIKTQIVQFLYANIDLGIWCKSHGYFWYLTNVEMFYFSV